MPQKTDCERCGDSFGTGKVHMEIIYQRQVTEDQPAAIKLCPDCSDAFENFLSEM